MTKIDESITQNLANIFADLVLAELQYGAANILWAVSTDVSLWDFVVRVVGEVTVNGVPIVIKMDSQSYAVNQFALKMSRAKDEEEAAQVIAKIIGSCLGDAHLILEHARRRIMGSSGDLTDYQAANDRMTKALVSFSKSPSETNA